MFPDTPLRRIGFWAAIDNPDHDSRWPDVRKFVDPAWNESDRLSAGFYLDRGMSVNAWMGCSSCRFCGTNNGCEDLTDGTYLWPEGLAHYIREHQVRLPDEFIHHMYAETARLEQLPVDDDWWVHQR
jgi:hypothetical protein